MTRYVIADTHFDHEGVLEYTDRPFASVAEMNRTLVDNWNAVVGADDEVVFLGDFAIPSEPTTVRRWLRQLNGDIVFVAGDHDDGVGRTAAITARDAHRFEAGGYRFYCAHSPGETPDDEWLLYGHHHDMRPAEFPFIDPEKRRVNVSVEMIGYEPLSVEELVGYLDRREHLAARPE